MSFSAWAEPTEPKRLAVPRRQAAQAANTSNRGSKSAGYYVLRNTWIPAILVEVGFLSNVQEEKLLNTEEYRQKIAEGVAQGIINYASR